MKHITYKTEGTCSQFIDIDVDDKGIVQQVYFTHKLPWSIGQSTRTARESEIRNKAGLISGFIDLFCFKDVFV